VNLINEKDLAKKLDISVHKLRKDRIKQRGIKAYRLGRAVRYDLNDVEKYLKDNSIRLTT
jgi:excisionase family DNA binding protein